MFNSADLALISGVDGGRVTAHRFVLGAASRDTNHTFSPMFRNFRKFLRRVWRFSSQYSAILFLIFRHMS